MLAHGAGWHSRNAVGRRADGGDFTDDGAQAVTSYRTCLKVLAVGDSNGVAVAQQTHESLLQQMKVAKHSSLSI